MRSNQDTAFWQSEGSAWYARNAAALHAPDFAVRDMPLMLIERSGIRPATVLEVGCSEGRRLAELHDRYGCECWGIDPSEEAIERGRILCPDITLTRELCSDLAEWGATFALVIAGFFLYVTDRSLLMRSLAELDRVTADGGHLLVYDFLPDHPTKTPYRDVPGLYSYKLDYSAVFRATGMYREVDRVIFDHDTHEIGDAPSERRAGCVLLKKESAYEPKDH